MADDTIGDILKDVDFDGLEPNSLLAALIGSDSKVAKKITKKIERATTALAGQMDKRSKEFSLPNMLGIDKATQQKIKKNLTEMANNKGGKAPVKNPLPQALPPTQAGKETSFFDKEEEKGVIIEGISDEAAEAIGKYINADKGAVKQTPQKGGGGGLMGLLKGLIPIGLVAGGVFALYKGLSESSKFRGTLKIIGEQLLDKGLAKIGKFLKPLKKIVEPFFESIGKILKPMKDKLFKPFSKIFKGLKGFADNLLKGMIKPLGKLTSKMGGKSIFKMLGAKLAKFAKVGLKGLKKVPGLGAIISGFFAYQRFKSGDIKGGLIEIASGLASMVPGIGTAISIGLDVFNAVRDAKKTDEEIAGEKANAEGFSFKVAIGKIFEKMKDLPVIKRLVDVIGGFKDIFTGDILGGLKRVGTAIPGIGMLIGIFEDSKEAAAETMAESGNFSFKSFFGKLKDKMLSRIINMLPEKILGVSVRARAAKMLGIEGYGEPVDDVDKATAEDIANDPELKGKARQAAGEKRNKLRELQEKQITAKAKLEKGGRGQSNIRKGIKSRDEEIAKLTKELESLNAKIMGAEEQQDFIMRPGSDPVKFSGADTLIGAKEGGPLVQALGELNSNFVKFAEMNSGSVEQPVIVNNTQAPTPPAPVPPERQPSFKEINDVVIQRATFWRTNYGYVMP